MPALYRTYRPKTFKDVVGQSYIVRALRNAVIADKPAHAYLFCGGRGLGKTTLARVLARALNCPNKQEGEACLTCPICIQFDKGTFLDLVEVDAASNTGVDNVRSLIDTIHFQPTSGTYKVYIIDEAHMLSKGAWNALLKTLEEPPVNTVFILATTEAGKVPATINSRAQRFDFPKFSAEEIGAHIGTVLAQEQVHLSEPVVALIAKAANGGMRDALTMLDQILSLGPGVELADAEQLFGVTDEETLLTLLGFVRTGNTQALPGYVDRLAARYPDITAVNRDLLELLRALLSIQVQASTPESPRLAEAAAWFSESDMLFVMRQFLRSYKEAGATPRAELPLLIASLEAALKFQDRPGGSAQSAPSSAPVGQKAPHPSSTGRGVEPAAFETLKLHPVQTVPASQVPEGGSGTLVLNRELVDGLWHEVTQRLKTVNGPLSTLLKNSPICDVEANCITVGVKYLFHKEQLESVKNRQLLASILEKVFGGKVRVKAQFVEKVEEPVSTAQTLSDALKVFSGELVE